MTQQLRAAVELAALSGELAANEALPPIRQLAQSLGIAPGTVARAYRALVVEGVLVSRPRRGVFAAPTDADPTGPDRSGPVADLIDEAVRAATATGLQPKEFLRLVAERVSGSRGISKRLAIVGDQDATLKEWTGVIAGALSDLNVSVVAISYQELETGAAAQKTLGVEWFVVPMLETRRARHLLGPHAHRILPMTRTLRNDVREFVRAQPPLAKFGIIAVTDETLRRTIAAVQRLHPLRVPPLVAVAGDQARVAEVVASADVLVIGPQALPHLRSQWPLRQPHMAFVFVPDDSTIRRLRTRILLSRSELEPPVTGEVPY